MNVEFQRVEDPALATSNSTIVDIHTTINRVYILHTTHRVDIYNIEMEIETQIFLEKTSKRCSHIYADATTLMIAFEDGTMELRQIMEDYRLLRVTYDRDAAGPGSKRIGQISASPDFVMVQSYENGLLIYSKPSLLFYKWIMLGGHCEVLNFSIKYHLLYVLIDRPEHEIHMLDFNKHRIFEQEVLAYDYIDIEFDGMYLYAATSSSVIVYLQEEAERPMRQEKVSQVNFNENIINLIRYNDEIYVVFKDHMVCLDIQVPSFENPIVKAGEKIEIETPTFAKKLKYDYFGSQPHEHFPSERSYVYQEGDKSIWKVDISLK